LGTAVSCVFPAKQIKKAGMSLNKEA
jgi:hypothetical protein